MRAWTNAPSPHGIITGLVEQSEDEVQNAAHDVVVDVREGSSGDSQCCKCRIENQRQHCRAESEQESAEQCALDAAVDASEDTAGTTREEADTSSRDHNGLRMCSNHDTSSDQSAGNSTDESEQNCIRSEREYCRAVNCRLGVRDPLFGNSDECCSDLSDELTDTIDQDAHASCELEAFNQRPDEPDVVSGRSLNKFECIAALDSAGNDSNIEQNDHEQCNGEDEVTEQTEPAREIKFRNILALVLAVLAAYELADVASQRVADQVEVAHCDVIRTCEFVHEWLSNGRKSCAAEAEDDAADQNGNCCRSTISDEDECDDASEVQEVLACEEDCLELRELCKYEVCCETDNHAESNFSTISIESQSSCDFNLCGDTGDSEASLEQRHEGIDNSAHCAGSDVEDHESYDGLDNAVDGVFRTLLLKQKTDECNDSHDKSCISYLSN